MVLSQAKSNFHKLSRSLGLSDELLLILATCVVAGSAAVSLTLAKRR